jgi:Spy/CpxP family protein refolding chaperone
MNRTILVVLLGLAVGLGTHAIYFQLHRPAGLDSLDGQLAWIRDELKLTDAQYAQIRELHEASSPRLRALAAEVARMQAEFAAFENTRRATDKVDFIEFAQFVETRRNINRECQESTRRLVMATADVMTPEQRAHYLGLVAGTEYFKQL